MRGVRSHAREISDVAEFAFHLRAGETAYDEPVAAHSRLAEVKVLKVQSCESGGKQKETN